jgi:putative ABC transport system substrate-binding protein
MRPTTQNAFRKIYVYYAVLFFLIIPKTVDAHRVAIFDFDDRLNDTNTVAKYIERRLTSADAEIQVEQFTGKGKENLSVKIMQHIEQSGFDLVITITSDALIIAHHTLKKTPVLYTNANNPLFLGFKTLGPPGGNISGASYYVSIEEQFQLYRKIQPDLSFVGFIFDRDNKSRKVELPEARKTCRKLGIRYEIEIISKKEELATTTESLLARGVNAVIATSSGKIYDNIQDFISLCNRQGVPVYSFNRKGVKNGAVAALASDYYLMVDRLILPMALKTMKEKVNPGTMPAGFLKENIINLNAQQIEKLKLKVPHIISRKANWIK